MRYITSALVAIAFVFLGFEATAFAATAVSSATQDSSWYELAKPAIDAIRAGNGWLAAFALLMLAVATARKYLPDSAGGSFVRSDIGGVVTAFAFSFGAAGFTALTGGVVMSGAVALTALKVALAAVGGYQVLHKLGSALVASKWFQDKAPAFIKSGLALLLGLFGSDAVEKAEKAGTEAVAKNPPKGTGEYTDVE